MIRLALFLFVLLPFFAFSQTKDGDVEFAEDKVGTFKTGVVFGVNGAKIDGDGYGPNFKGFNKLGANAGLRTWVVVHPNWQPGLELLFTQKGSFKRANEFGVGQFKYIVDYVQVPVMVSYVIEKRVQAYTGLAYSRLIRSKTFINGVEEDLVAQYFKKNDFNFLIGGSVYLDQKKHWVADLRYEISLLDMYDGALSYGSQTLLQQRSKSIAVRMLYMF